MNIQLIPLTQLAPSPANVRNPSLGYRRHLSRARLLARAAQRGRNRANGRGNPGNIGYCPGGGLI
jgi:hypothetical protein